MHNDVFLPLYHTEYLPTKVLYALPIHPSLRPTQQLATTDLLTVSFWILLISI